MLIRNCAGGVVFKDDKVLVLKNDKDEWVLPKGKIRDNQMPPETALNRVQYEAGIDAEIVSTAGETAYEFYSITRNAPVCNKITWYIMEAADKSVDPNKEEGFSEGGFISIEEAMDKITYSQDKSLVSLSYKRYNEFREYREKLGSR